MFLLKYEVTWKGYLKGNIRDINAKIVSDKLLIFLEKKIIFEANNICLNTSTCIWNWTLLWNFFYFISHKSNLLFSVLFKVFALFKTIKSIEYKPRGAMGTSITKLAIIFSIGWFWDDIEYL